MTKRPKVEDYLNEKKWFPYNFIQALNDYIDKLELQIDLKTSTTKDMEIETIKKNYVAVFRMGYAIGVEAGDWEVATQTKLCNEQTTIKEIYDWFKSKMPEAKFHCEIVEAE